VVVVARLGEAIRQGVPRGSRARRGQWSVRAGGSLDRPLERGTRRAARLELASQASA